MITFLKYLLGFILLALTPIGIIAQNTADLEKQLSSASAEEKPSILNQLAEAHLASDPEKAIEYAEKALKAARKVSDVNEEAGALINLGSAYGAQKNLKKAPQYFKDAIKIFDQYNQSASSAYVWNKLADLLIQNGKFAEGMDANIKALELLKKANDKSGVVNMNIEIGDLYVGEKRFESAIPYYKAVLKVYEESRDIRGQVNILNRIATAYSNWGNYDEANIFITRAYDMAKKNNLNAVAKDIEKNMEIIKKNISGWEKSQTEFEKQKEVETQTQMKIKELQINQLAQEKVKSMEEIEQMSAEAQVKELKIKMQSDEIMRKQMEAESQARANDLLKKEKELSDAEVKRQEMIIWGAIGFSALGVLLTFFIFMAYRNKKKSNDLLKQKNEIIYKQKEQIEQKNILITDSIDYAKNIQDAILPSAESLKQYFPESFILYTPKDIVSGDFYWFHEEPGECFCLAAADCTGHGVPGAFMSLLGFIMLDDIIKRHKSFTPANVLRDVNNELMELLHQDGQNSTGKFGMDVALLRYDLIKQEIIYAGAQNSLVIVRSNGELNEIKADKTSIGTSIGVPFKDNTVSVSKGDYIYIYSDGFQDQIGGEKRKKFMSLSLKELLQKIHTLSPERQKEELKKAHQDWKGKNDQTDDILVIGLKV